MNCRDVIWRVKRTVTSPKAPGRAGSKGGRRRESSAREPVVRELQVQGAARAKAKMCLSLGLMSTVAGD